MPVVEKHLLRVLAGVDHPALEVVGYVLTRLHFPELVAVDFVARSLMRTFPVAAPAWLTRRNGAVDPNPPPGTDLAPYREDDLSPQIIAATSFTLGRLAHLVSAGAALLPRTDIESQ